MSIRNKRPARIDVKLRESVSADGAEKALQHTPGLRSVVQIFPEESDPELRSLFLLEVEPKALGDALQVLEHQAEVEFAHENAPCPLIR